MSACPYVFSFEIALIAVFTHYERGAAALSAHPPMPISFEGIFERLLKTRWRSFGSTSTAGLEREFHVGSHRPSMIAELYRRLPREHLDAACRNKKIQASGGRGLRQGHATVHASVTCPPGGATADANAEHRWTTPFAFIAMTHSTMHSLHVSRIDKF